ncbi:FHA domain-containing protein [Serinibacter salmoneus]|uniref:Zinc ribbon protein n=1 Tax=Serinibacter salmoneus TaxID=556530 RepID=A0A2A9CWK4_9MICO|nr:FHA domain-containing protein [Serinibacter salmoneus]PFG18808.1 zinc ribbon protein [Serinibacter salmoneus]
MSARCPDGHLSQAQDYCDTCGLPIGASSSAAPAPTPAESGVAPTALEPRECPHCGAPAAARALFCENCGYDFTTGTAPGSLPRPGGVGSRASLDSGGSAPAGTPGGGEEDEDVSAVVRPRGAAPQVQPDSGGRPHAGADVEGLTRPTSAVTTGPTGWVAEVWVDPDWFSEQDPPDPLPSVGHPQVIPLRARSVLVGRPSRSRGITPDVDCSGDPGVSRRHCQLTFDGVRWSVEDLQSANGTFLGPVGDPLPVTPVRPGERRVVEPGTRLYVGGWTRIALREALPSEA